MSKPKNVAYVMSTGGVGNTITGSSTLLNCHVHGKIHNIGIDFGISQGKDEIRNNNHLITGNNIEAFIITHAHMDHMGGLPFLKDFTGKIYATKETFALGYELLCDAAKSNLYEAAKSYGISIDAYYAMLKELDEMKRRKTNPNNMERYQDLADIINEVESIANFTLDDVERINKQFCIVIPYERFIIVDGIYGRLIPNPHLPGAISAEIYIGEVIEEDMIGLSFSGDIGPKDGILYKSIPYHPNEYIQYAWLEATHGVEERSQTVAETYRELKNRVFEAIQNDSPLIIASFALDRSAKILWLMNKIIDETNVSIPIYWDTPLGYRELQLYQNFYRISIKGESFWFNDLGRNPFDDNELIVCNRYTDHMDALESDGAKVVITASAFGDGGRILDYFDRYIQEEDADFVFAGWLSPECNSYILHKAIKGESIELFTNGVWKKYEKNCQTHQITGLTSHGFYPEFEDYIKRFPNLNGLILNHGSRDSKNALAEKLKQNYDYNIVIPELYDDDKERDSYFQIDAEQMVTIPSIEGYKIFESILKK